MGRRLRREMGALSSLSYLLSSPFDLRSSIFYLRGLPHDGVGVGLPHDAVEPTVEVVAQRARAEHAEAVLLPEAIDLDDYI